MSVDFGKARQVFFGKSPLTKELTRGAFGVSTKLTMGEVRDAALISAAQRVEHYEMAAYGCVREYAKLLGQEEIAKLLEATLEEERGADEKLSKISKTVNSVALQAA